jgi:YVTN family beta-propeller protein
LQPDEKYLWVGLESPPGEKAFAGISVIDTEILKSVALVSTGAGHHEFAFSDDSRHAYVSNQQDNSLAIIDVDRLSRIKNINTGSSPVSLSYSTLSKALYIATEQGGVIVIDKSGQEITRIDTGSSLKTIRFSPDGRWGFAASQKSGRVFIIDAANNRVTHKIEVEGEPDQITFTDNFAYVRQAAGKNVSMIKLEGLDRNTPAVLSSFPAGQKAPNEMPGLLLSDAVVPTPERSAVVVANPLDKVVYYYMEGMAAPMGSFKLFGRNPMAVLIVDRSLQETAPGYYTGTVQLPPSGPYTLAVLLDSPAVYHCFSMQVNTNPLLKKGVQPAKVEYLVDNLQGVAGASTRIDLKVADPLTRKPKSGVLDLQVLTFRIPGTWQKRTMATSSGSGSGIYTLEFTPPTTGIYQVYVQSPSLDISFEDSPSLTLHAVTTEADRSRGKGEKP